ncbi:recombinase family protein [Brevibacillus brevis]|uniref:recombinase family protein n=1 Tax=Brevibacillus brevis TaxID=1393 RepID=UPI0007D8B2D0|nr:recombinase family protein [Brevibacillus brevis]
MIAIYSRSAVKNNDVIAEQKHKCLSFVNGQEVVFFSDNGVSGLEINKEGLDSLFELAKNGTIKKVITLNSSRFSRNEFEAQEVEIQLNALGVDVEYVETYKEKSQHQ